MIRRITARAGTVPTRSAAPVRPAGSGNRGPTEWPGGDPRGPGDERGKGVARPTGPCPTCGRHSVDLPMCRCGHSIAAHNIENQRKPCSLSSCGCTEYLEVTE